ncbi:hypothetical protein ACS0TY_013608 [Phlomoides rotata]
MFIRGFSSNIIRYRPLMFYNRYPYLAFHFSTLEFALDPTNKNSNDESHVLNQLSDILPISIRNPSSVTSPGKQLEIRAADEFLPPEDKLRGIFLQKLRGESATFRALSGVGVELNEEVFAKVLNKGNLSGGKIIAFFNWAMKQPNLSEGIGTCNLVLKALGRRKFFAHMMEMLKDMGNRGMSPNSETLSIVMDSYLRAHQVSKATIFFGELDKYGLKCDEETLSVALSSLSQRSHVGTACLLFNKMREKVQCDCSMYNIIIGGLSKFGRVSEVEKFLQMMIDDGVEPDFVTYSYVIEGFGRAGRFDDAVKIFKCLEEKGSEMSIEVYNAMIFNCIANSDVDEALKYYEGMQSNCLDPNMDTYVRIISFLLKSRRVSDAIEMFDDMLVRGIIPHTGILTEFIRPLCSYGPPYAALLVYKKATKAGCRISITAYKLLLLRLSRFGKCGMLLSVWDEMQESGYASDMQVYEYIINGLCNTGQLETAVQVMEECLRKGFFPGKIICSKLNNKLMDSNKVEMAYKLFLKLRKARVSENAQSYWRAKGWHF